MQLQFRSDVAIDGKGNEVNIAQAKWYATDVKGNAARLELMLQCQLEECREAALVRKSWRPHLAWQQTRETTQLRLA